MLGKKKKSAENILQYFFSFQEIGFDIPCDLSPQEIISWNVKAVFSEKKSKKISSSCRLEYVNMKFVFSVYPANTQRHNNVVTATL